MQRRTHERRSACAAACLWSGLLLPALIALAGCGERGGRVDAGEGSSRADAATVFALGRLEPATGLRVIGLPPGSRVRSVAVTEGETVEAGATLAVLEGHELAQRRLELAQAQLAAFDYEQETQRRGLDAQRAAEDAARTARMAKLREAISILEGSIEASEEFVLGPNSDLIPGAERVQRRSELDRVRVTLLDRQQQLESLTIEEEWLPQRRAAEDRGLAAEQPRRQALQGEVDVAREALAQATVTAPIGGTVLEVLTDSGEVSDGRLLLLADLSDIVAIGEVDHTLVARLDAGDRASVKLHDQNLRGAVQRISRVVGKNRLVGVDPLEPVDRRVVEVTIRLERPEQASRFLGLEVEVTIEPGTSQSLRTGEDLARPDLASDAEGTVSAATP